MKLLKIDSGIDSPLKDLFNLYLNRQNAWHLLCLSDFATMAGLKKNENLPENAKDYYITTLCEMSLNRIFSLLVEFRQAVTGFLIISPDHSFLSQVKHDFFGEGRDGEYLGTSGPEDFEKNSRIALEPTEHWGMEQLRSQGFSVSFYNSECDRLSFGEEVADKLESIENRKIIVEVFNLSMRAIRNLKTKVYALRDDRDNIQEFESIRDSVDNILNLKLDNEL